MLPKPIMPSLKVLRINFCLNKNFFTQMKKYIYLVSILFVSLLELNAAKPFTVVLDPGHGGSDVGATRAGICESHIVLDIAQLVGDMLGEHSDIKVAYTRKTDKKLKEEERMELANKADGDIFVSIHVNSAYNEEKKRDVTSAHGVEVYIQTVENIERKTNTLREKGSIKTVNKAGEEEAKRYDYSSNKTFNAIYEIKQAQIFNLSTNLARYIGTEMGAKDRNLRGVKQKSLYVTWQTLIPSVLIEVGYITNEEERRFMNSQEGKRILARGIYDGIIRYKKDFDLSREALAGESVNRRDTDTNTNLSAVSATPKDEVKSKDEVVFMWQVFISSVPLKDDDYRFKKLKCSYYKDKNMYKYTYGSSTDYDEVLRMQAEIRKLFPDAFMIAMKNGKRVDINEVRQ
ncbi:N-acetylmuramoyl-L-alanine amidase, family 3 [Bacteroidetes oral taxon 274 str. F0058]|nr:N-acetylmuramoyl-L-alanine amidase, family 3 [Bacteroidetes oral taxon 274 str. F0058]